VQHTNTSSMSSGSTTSLFYRDLGARWQHDDSRWRPKDEKNVRKRVGGFARCAPLPICPFWKPVGMQWFSGAIAHATSRAASHATSHTFSHLFSLAGRPASRAAPASDASCQAIGGRNGSLSPRGERGVSDDLAPRPQPLPRAVPAAGTSAECAAKLYWHPLSSTRWRGSWGSCTAAGGGDRWGE